MSMNCPVCDAKGSCLNSRRRNDSNVYRTYRCAKDHCWSSIEFIARISEGRRKPGGSGRPLMDEVNDRLLAEAKAELRAKLLEVLDGAGPQPVVENA